MFNKILVCLDGSQLSEQILPYAEAQAKSFSSKLTLIKVVTLPGVVSQDYAGTTIFDQLKQAEDEAKSYLSKIAKDLRLKGIEVNYEVLNDSPIGQTIVSYAHKHAFNLIALATHGHGGLGRLFLGSVADYILQKSDLPMLIIRPK